MTRHGELLTGGMALAAFFVLSGCGSGGSLSLLDDAVFASDAGTVAEALDSGKTLSAYNAKMSAAARMEGEAWTDTASPEVKIAKNGQGGVDVTVGDETVSYTAADLSADGFGWETNVNNNFRGIFAWSGPGAEEAVAGDAEYDHHQVWAYFWGTGDTESFNGFAIVGTETRPSALEDKANATYSGHAVADVYEKGGASFDRVRFRGDVNMSADFAAGEIEGNIGNLTSDTRVDRVWGGEQAVAGNISMDKTGIDGNSFSGSLTPDQAFVNDAGDFAGSYGGKFYGENGQEVGGVIKVEDNESVGSGFFTAGQN